MRAIFVAVKAVVSEQTDCTFRFSLSACPYARRCAPDYRTQTSLALIVALQRGGSDARYGRRKISASPAARSPNGSLPAGAVISLVGNPLDASHALRAVCAPRLYVTCSQVSELLDVCRRNAPVAMLIAPLMDSRGQPTADIIRLAKRNQPGLTVVVVASGGHNDSRLLLDIARDGADVLVRPGFDDLSSIVREALRLHNESAHPALHSIVAQALENRYAGVETIVDYWFADPKATRMAVIASALGIPRRTISARFKRAGLPSPAAFLMRLRLLRVIHSLRFDRTTISHAGRSAGFNSTASIRTALMRHLRLRPSDLRDGTAMERALRSLTMRV